MVNGLTILRASEQNTPWAVDLLVRSEPWSTLGTTVAQCTKTLSNPEYSIFIASLEENPCGLIVLDPNGLASSPYIKTIVVEDSFRGRGIGGALVEFAEDHFRKESKHIFLCVSSFNKQARHFYQNRGYHQVGEFNDYIIKGASEILLSKHL